MRKTRMKTATKTGTTSGPFKLPPGYRQWDTAEFLNTEEDIAEYWEAVIEEDFDNPEMMTQALGVIARAHGILQLSKDTGMTRAGLYKALSSNSNPSLCTFVKIATALGLTIKLQPHKPRAKPSRKKAGTKKAA